MSKPIYDVCVRLRELGIDYNLARAMLDAERRHGQLNNLAISSSELIHDAAEGGLTAANSSERFALLMSPNLDR
jgi:hypothetical protein